jgi:hypothetical protein
MKKLLLGTLAIGLVGISAYSFAAKESEPDILTASIGICAGHYFMTKQYDMAQTHCQSCN